MLTSGMGTEIDFNEKIWIRLWIFLNLKKTFDKVSHSKEKEVLELTNFNLRIIAYFYWNPNATVRIDGDHIEKNRIQCGVRRR